MSEGSSNYTISGYLCGGSEAIIDFARIKIKLSGGGAIAAVLTAKRQDLESM